MKKIASIVLVAAFVFGVFGATPAYASVVCEHPDHAVYGDEVNRSIVTSCISQSVWDKAIAYAKYVQDTGFKFARGTSVTLKNGTLEYCPFWYFSGCVIDRALIQ